MLDFPASPTVGQTFQSAQGSTWQWDGVKWTPQTASAPVLSGNTGRNLIHNPTFTVAQRGVGPFTTASGYTLDRWTINRSNDTASFTQAALADTDRAGIGDESAQYSLQNVFTGSATAGSYNFAAQRIENVRRLSGKTVTISLWAKAATGAPKLGLNMNQYFGTGGSPSAQVNIAPQAITISAAWARYSATFSVPSISGMTLGTNGDSATQLDIWFSATSDVTNAGGIGVQSSTIQLYGVQLEVGSTATPLDYGGSPQQQLAQCQRFYQTGKLITSGWGGAVSQGIYFSSMLAVTMRANPTIMIPDTTGSSNSTFISAGAYFSPSGYYSSVYLNGSVNAAGYYTLAVGYTLSADL